MPVRIRGILLGLIAASGGIALAVAMGSSAGAAGPTTTSLGSTTGTPSQNICVASINCTYIPFTNASTPSLQVPFDGTVTTFSVNAGSTGGKVELRVLRPANGGQFTGAGTSPAQTITNTGGQTFSVSLPVKAGDVLALDNDSSALMFDTSSTTPVTKYFQPGLADGATGAPNNTRSGYRLLLAATVQASTTTTTVTTTTTTTTPPPGVRPVLSNVSQTHKIWKRGKKLATASRLPKIPVGTTFKFRLNARAAVTLAFRQQLRKRKPLRGKLSFLAHAGLNKLFFQGRLSKSKRLPPGHYVVTITAVNTGGKSTPRSLRFLITS